MKLFIHCDAKGVILSVVKVLESSAQYHPFAHVEASDHIVKTEMNSELNALFAHEISEQYQVDLDTKKLKKKATSVAVKEIKRKVRRAHPEHRGR